MVKAYRAMLQLLEDAAQPVAHQRLGNVVEDALYDIVDLARWDSGLRVATNRGR